MNSSSEFGDLDPGAFEEIAEIEAALLAGRPDPKTIVSRKPPPPPLPKRANSVVAKKAPVASGSRFRPGVGAGGKVTGSTAALGKREESKLPLEREGRKEKGAGAPPSGKGKAKAKAQAEVYASDEALWGDDSFVLEDDLDVAMSESQLLRGAVFVQANARTSTTRHPPAAVDDDDEIVILDSEDEDDRDLVVRTSQVRFSSTQSRLHLEPPRASQNRQPPPVEEEALEDGDFGLSDSEPPRRAPGRSPSPLPPSSPPPEIIPDSDDELFDTGFDFDAMTASQFDAVEAGALPPKPIVVPPIPQPNRTVLEIDDEEDDDSILMPPPRKRPSAKEKGKAKATAPSATEAAPLRKRPQHHCIPSADSSSAAPAPTTRRTTQPKIIDLSLEDSPAVVPSRRPSKRAVVFDSSSPAVGRAKQTGAAKFRFSGTKTAAAAIDADSSVEIILPKALGRLRRGRAASSDEEDEDSALLTHLPSPAPGPAKPKRPKRPKLNFKAAARMNLFDLEAINSDASSGRGEASSEAYDSADSDDRRFVAAEGEEEEGEDSPGQRQFYLDSLGTQAPQMGFAKYLPGAYRMSKGVWRGGRAPTPTTPDDVSYSYDSFCVPDDEVEMDGASSDL